MTEKKADEKTPMPPLGELKAIGYDLFMTIGALEQEKRRIQAQLNQINQDIFNHPERKQPAAVEPPLAPEKPEGEPA